MSQNVLQTFRFQLCKQVRNVVYSGKKNLKTICLEVTMYRGQLKQYLIYKSEIKYKDTILLNFTINLTCMYDCNACSGLVGWLHCFCQQCTSTTNNSPNKKTIILALAQNFSFTSTHLRKLLCHKIFLSFSS